MALDVSGYVRYAAYGMLYRFWLVVSLGWAVMMLGNGATRARGLGYGDFLAAALPLLAGLLLWRAGRFVIGGRL